MQKLILLVMVSVVVAGCQRSVTRTDNYSAKNSENKGVVVTNTSVSLINNSNNAMPFVELENISSAVIKTNLGNITVEFYKNESPKTVENFVKLAQNGFYDGTRFHRIIADFMIQGGDPLSKDPARKNMWGTGGPGYEFADEINEHKLVKGSLAMANAGANTNGSQFFIVTADATSWLDGKHTNFGRVTNGMDVVERIGALETDAYDRPLQDVIVESIEVK